MHTIIKNFNPETTTAKLIHWLNINCKSYPAQGFVIGLSGGIDSAVVAALLMRTHYPATGLILPSATTSQVDIQDAYRVAEYCQLPVIEIPITPVFDQFITATTPLNNPKAVRQNIVSGNVQARLRMMMLYTYAQNHDYIVVGTDNACEWLMGYFTKFGDGAADIAPLIHLQKQQVYDLAEYLGIPSSIIHKKPSAGLWVGQTDEDEMGVTYPEIDAYLRGESVSATALERIHFWHKRSHHKRRLPLFPEWDDL